jgi:hypothetical protein
MKTKNRKNPILLSFLTLSLFACGGGGGGGVPNPASFRQEPKVKTDLKGTWEIKSVKVLESTVPGLIPQIEGDILVLSSKGILEWENLEFSEASLSKFEDRKFDWYVNQIDGSKLDFGYGWDLLEKGKDYDQTGMRGVAIDENTLLMEYFEFYQAGKKDPRDHVKLHFVLRRRSFLAVSMGSRSDTEEKEPERTSISLFRAFLSSKKSPQKSIQQKPEGSLK